MCNRRQGAHKVTAHPFYIHLPDSCQFSNNGHVDQTIKGRAREVDLRVLYAL